MNKLNFVLIGLTLIALLVNVAPNAKIYADDYSRVLGTIPREYRDGVEKVLNLASSEWNDGGLIDALQYYPEGSAKHRAACFLIANMDKHVYVDYVNPDDPLNPFSPEDTDIDWLREYIYDYSVMSSDLLIENIEWAFKVRDEFPWCRNLPEDVFFEYVLPYRSTEEPVHSWRPLMYETYKPLAEGFTNALEVAEAVNKYNTSIFHFSDTYYRHPEDRDIPTLLSCGMGRCEDMSNLSNYSLWSIGVPTTSDFTPYWPKGDNNHAWNAVYYNGQWHTFMGCEAATAPVYNGIKSSTFAKVYRKSFSADPIMPPSPDGTEPPRLMRTPAVDVTSEYTTVSDFELDVVSPTPAIYLCVHNFAAWQGVGGAWANDGRVRFTDVGNDEILYSATQYVEDETGWGDHYPVAPPFVLHRDGSIEFINPCPVTESVGDITVTGWIPGGTLDEGIEVTLYRYVGCQGEDQEEDAISPMEWKPVGTATTVSDGVTVSATFPTTALEEALYLLSDNPEELRDNSRPFIWKESGITYY